VCKITLTSMPRSGDRNYGCRKDQGGGRCGHVFVSADNIERHLLGIILPLADSPALRYLVQAEDRAGAVGNQSHRT
jgi:hypothetical protein